MSWKCPECNEINDSILIRCVCGFEDLTKVNDEQVSNFWAEIDENKSRGIKTVGQYDSIRQTDYNVKDINALKIWVSALLFHLRHFIQIFIFFPFLLIPVFNDGLHSLLIAQIYNNKKPNFISTIRLACKLFPSVLSMKFYFWICAIIWGFVPVYGIIKGARYRASWAMASNVAVFEGLTGVQGERQCSDLISMDSSGKTTRTFLTIPTLIYIFMTIIFVYFTDIHQFSFVPWVYLGVVLWLMIPVSSVLNTLYYLSLTRNLTLKNWYVHIPKKI